MKKILFIALAIAMGFTAFAQFESASFKAPKAGTKAVWDQIGTPFTTTTIDGQTISLQSWLDSGYYVLIDYSCTWCGPCFNVHSAGIMEGIYDTYGPQGNNTMRVIWIEVDPSTTLQDIYGTGSSTQGNWTVTSTGDPIPYPICDDANASSTCSSLDEGYVPYMVVVTPNGYYRSVYGDDDGIPYPLNVQTSIANMATIMQNSPRAGVAPMVEIDGPSTILAGNQAAFTANIVSVDQVTDITWTIQGATVTTGNNPTITTSWENTGNYTVEVSVTNTTGTTTKSITVNVFNWDWDATMGYGYNIADEFASEGFRFNSGSTSTWGAMFPARFLTGRNYLTSVSYYAIGAINYTLDVYQGGETAPETKIYSRTLKASGAGWQTMNCSGAVALDQTKNLWVTLTAPHASGYVMSLYLDASGSDYYYSGDPNGCWAYASSWSTMVSMGYPVTWAIKATTGDSPNAGISTIGAEEVAIYPNPTTGMVNVDAANVKSVEVYDMAGRMVMSANESTIDMSNCANGVYMLRVNTENGTTMQKVVKR